jgi:hypothetical protein
MKKLSIKNCVVMLNERSHRLETGLKTKRDETYEQNQRLKPKLYNRLKFLFGMNARICRTFYNWRKPSYTIPTAAILRVVTFHVYIPHYYFNVSALMAGNQNVISY